MAFMLISIELPSLRVLDDIWLSPDLFTLMVVGIEFGIVTEEGLSFLVGCAYISLLVGSPAVDDCSALAPARAPEPV